MALQPSSKDTIDRATTAPFLLRLFWRPTHPLAPHEFSVAPPNDTTGIADYTALLPASIRQQSVQIYTWPTCTLAELTGLLTSVMPEGALPEPSAGTRLVYKLIFPDTRGAVVDGGRGRWIDRPLGSVVVGGGAGEDAGAEMGNGAAEKLTGDADKTLADARFVIGDYVACTIYAPSADGRVAPLPSMNRGPPRDPYPAPRGPAQRENGYGHSRGGGYHGGYGGGRGGSGAPPMSDWRRGERPPGPPGGGYGRGGGGGGYRGGRGRPY